MATEIAQAYVAILPKLDGKALARQVGDVDLADSGSKSGKSWLGGAAKVMGGAAVAAIGATAGIAIKKGIDRALTLENAEAKLKGLKFTAEEIVGVRDSALAAVSGTAYGLGSAMTAATGALGAGVKQGKELSSYLTLVGDAATQSNIGFDQMAIIFNKVQGAGKLTGDTLAQMTENGLQAGPMIAKGLGVTIPEMQKMVSEGKVTAAEFQRIMVDEIGGSALASGETTQGAYDNMLAALGRLGEKAIGGVFPKFAGLFQGVTGLIDDMGPSVLAFGEWTGVMFDKVSAGAGAIATLLGGEFNATVREALGVEEDSGLVDALLSVNAIAGGVKDTLGGVLGILRDGDFNGEAFAWLGAQEDSPLVDTLFNIREGAIAAKDEVTGGLAAMVQAFKDGGNDVTSSGFAGFLEQIGLVGRMLWDSLGPTISGLLPQVVELASAFSPLGLVLDVLTPVLPQVGDALTLIATALSGTLAAVLPTVVGLLTTLAGVMSGALASILPVVVDLVLSLVEVFSGALVSLLPTVVGMIETLAAVLAEALPVVLPVIVKLVETLAGVLSGALASVLPVIVSVIRTLAGVIASLLPVLLPVISTLLDALLPVFLSLVEAIMPLVAKILPLVASLLTALVPVIVPLVEILAAVLTPVIGFLGAALEVVIGIIGGLIGWFVDLISNTDAVGGAFQGMRDTVEKAWAAVQSGIRTVWNWIRDYVFAPIKTGVAAVGTAFDLAKATMTAAWETVKTGVSTVWNWIRDNVFEPFKTGVAAIGTAFEGARDAVKTAWNQLGNIARAPINFIIKTVYTDGIKAVFDKIASAVGLDLKLPVAKEVPSFSAATGGVLPGWTPGRDVHHFSSPTGGNLHLSGGEAIMRPEFTRAVGGAAGVARLNAQARAGALGGQSFFLGGVWENVKNTAGNIGRFVTDTASNVKDMVVNVAGFLSDPAEGFKSLITTPMNNLLGTVMSGELGKMMVEVPRKAVTGIIDKALALIGQSASGGVAGGLPDMMAAGGWARPSRGRVTSAFGPRWGAFHNGTDFAGGGATYAAGAGTVSRVGWNVGYGNTGIGIMLNHGGGLETYYGHNPSMSAVRVKVGDMVRPGQHIGQEGATGNVTGVHLHWSAFRNGRAFDPMSLLGGGGGRGASLYDEGGWLPTGVSVVENRTGRPEPVFNPEQWESIKDGVNNGKVDLTDASIVKLADAITAAGVPISREVAVSVLGAQARSDGGSRQTRGISS